jgi:hypothetical protein
MAQLDVDLFDDFVFFAFTCFIFGFGDDDSEERVVDTKTDSFLAQFYIENREKLILEKTIIRNLIIKTVKI